MFPAGAAGAGLLILRLSLAVSLFALAWPLAGIGELRYAAVAILALALGIGIHTRLMACLTLATALGAALLGAGLILLVTHLATGMAVTLIGPGAFSADARLFGRRRITLPSRRPPAG